MIKETIVTLLAFIASGWADVAFGQPSPYAGQQSREIKALSRGEVDDLVNGRGMGLARPAELNQYPGPLHVLELASELRLSPAQRDEVEASRARMSAKARGLGAQILALERELDAAFARRTIDQARLNRLTAQIGVKQGLLRAAHLEAHIETAGLLSLEQISRYDMLRGYGSTPSGSSGGHGARHH